MLAVSAVAYHFFAFKNDLLRPASKHPHGGKHPSCPAEIFSVKDHKRGISQLIWAGDTGSDGISHTFRTPYTREYVFDGVPTLLRLSKPYSQDHGRGLRGARKPLYAPSSYLP